MTETFGHKQDGLIDIDVVPVDAAAPPARLVEDSTIIDKLEAQFAQALRSSERLSRLTRFLEEQALRYCVFGGWVRDTISAIQGLPMMSPPRDIDLVVRGIELQDLLVRLPNDVRPTIFGGIQSTAEPIPFDVWPLHETFLIRHLNLPSTFESLLQSTDFNINAGLFFPLQNACLPEFLDGGMFEALRTRTLAFNGALLPLPVMQCARLAAYAGKLSLQLSPAVQAFMQNILRSPEHREEVILGLCQNYPMSISTAGRQVIARFRNNNDENIIFL